jgi:hypothetical protein
VPTMKAVAAPSAPIAQQFFNYVCNRFTRLG